MRTYVPGFKPTIPVFEWFKAASALDRTTFVIGLFKFMILIFIAGFVP
jgi:hypothetical protein